MADKKISQLTALSAANVASATDVLAIVDTSATETKKITAKDLIDGALNGGTANGVLYLNGSKVATSGSALQFSGTKLSLSAAGGSDFVGVFTNTTAATPYILRIQEPATPASGYPLLDVVNNAGSTAYFRVDSGTGNVGIGTASPGSLWSGANRLVVGSGSAAAGLTIYTSTSTAGTLAFGDGTTGSDPYVGYVQYNHTDNTMSLGTSGTTKATLDPSGNLGLGTTSNALTHALTLYATGSTFRYMAVGNSNTGLNGTLFGIDGSGNTVINNTQNLAMLFLTNNTERGRFTAGGYFKASNDGTYFGSTSSYHELRSTGAAGDWNTVVTTTTATGANAYGIRIAYTGSAPNGTGNAFLSCDDNASGGTTRATIRSNGGLANYQANDVNLSDERTKKDIAPLGSMWAKIKALEIVTFKYKDQTHDDDNIGLIAQQVESVAPEFVDADGWGETPEDGVPLKSIYTADMYHAAIKALQEAMARIESLEADVAALKEAK